VAHVELMKEQERIADTDPDHLRRLGFLIAEAESRRIVARWKVRHHMTTVHSGEAPAARAMTSAGGS
jgi:hypothetical protein